MFRVPRRLMLTYVIIAMNVAAYVLTSVWGRDFMVTGDLPLEFLGQVNYHVIYDGWYWQLFTSMFVHADVVHIFGNMFFLLIFGLRAEELFDTKEYLLIYLMSGLAGNLLTLLPTLLMGSNMVSVGASGAIFGVFGAVIIYVRRASSQSIISALMIAFLMLLLNAGYGVNILAHLGGLVVGLMIGYLLATTKRKTQSAYTYSLSYTR